MSPVGWRPDSCVSEQQLGLTVARFGIAGRGAGQMWLCSTTQHPCPFRMADPNDPWSYFRYEGSASLSLLCLSGYHLGVSCLAIMLPQTHLRLYGYTSLHTRCNVWHQTRKGGGVTSLPERAYAAACSGNVPAPTQDPVCTLSSGQNASSLGVLPQ